MEVDAIVACLAPREPQRDIVKIIAAAPQQRLPIVPATLAAAAPVLRSEPTQIVAAAMEALLDIKDRDRISARRMARRARRPANP